MSLAAPTIQQQERIKPESTKRFFFLLVLLVSFGILRSAIATRLDDFTFDEPYHIVAGVSYVQKGDFRINPEHPPLVKLWVGSFVSATGFQLSPFRQFNDKKDERTFAEEDVYLHNDPDSVQRHSRIAMWGLNGLLLIGLGFALRRAFSDAVALGAILFLAIDPTVAAHLPVVMTDLPIALLAVSAVVLATVAFTGWAWTDLGWCSLALGLSLGAKHSAPVFAVFLAFAGVAGALIRSSRQPYSSRLLRIVKVCAVMLGALFILWGLYFFNFHESRHVQDEVFNRPLKDKIADVNSEAYRFTLTKLATTHALPRAYIWGMADVVRAGLVGRANSQLAFGRLFYNKAPRYFFPGVIAVKVPLGLSLLSILGVLLFLRGQTPREWRTPTIMLLAASLCFLLVLSSGATYAGIRHALPLLVFWSISSGFAVHAVLSSSSRFLRSFVVLALLAAIVSAVPVMRPWEYYNETVGGAANAYLYFDDEGVDLSQRVKEMSKYYHEVVEPTGEIPYVDYEWSESQARKRGVDWVGSDAKRDEDRMASSIWSGTIITEAKLISRMSWWDAPELRNATPVARFGNLMVFRGQFRMPGKTAVHSYFGALHEIFSDHPDLISAETLLRQSASLDPNAFFVNIELGNVRLRLGSRDDALRAYSAALEHAPNDSDVRRSIQNQIQRVSVEKNLVQIPVLRDPGME